jgi:dihydroorotate dehydrogenase (NAD+) catalytic subunit
MIDLAPNSSLGLRLASPVMIAAGCLGFGVEFGGPVALGVGALVTTSIRLRPRRAGPAARLLETPAGLLWADAAPIPGAEAVLRRYAGAWASWELPLLLSLAGESAEDYVALAEGIEGVEGVAGLEARLPADTPAAVQVVRRLRQATALPLLAKLPALDAGLPELAAAVVAAGADAVVLAGWRAGLAVLPDGRTQRGLLCGPALRPLALAQLAELVGAVEAPIVAGGGIAAAEDARAFLALGAAAVQVGSAALADPTLPARIASALAE